MKRLFLLLTVLFLMACSGLFLYTIYRPAPKPIALEFHWREIESPDYHDYVANLRKIGCPEETIRSIIIGEANQLYRGMATNLIEQISATNRYEFWRTDGFYSKRLAGPEIYRRELLAINRKRGELLNSLGMSGSFEDLDWAPQMKSSSEIKTSLEFLPLEKREPIRKITAKVSEQVKAAMGTGMKTLEGYEDAKALVKRIRQEGASHRAQILNPAEIELFELHTSDVADSVRRDFDGFDLSETEFRTLFKNRQAFQAVREQTQGEDTPESLKLSASARVQHDTTLQLILGEARYSEYLRLQSPDYRALIKFAEENDISKEMANQIQETRLSSETKAAGIRLDFKISEDAKMQRLRELKSNTEETLRKVAGPLVTESLLRTAHGAWLRQLDKIPSTKTGTGFHMISPVK